MPEYYQIPALALTILLAPAFGYLYLRFRDARTLLWFQGFLFCIVRMLCIYHVGTWYFADGHHPWVTAIGDAAAQIGATVFLASLSPLRFRLGKLNILYVVPYTLPLVVYAILFDGVFRGVTPSGPLFWIFPALGAMSLVAGLFWGFARGSMPRWLGVVLCALLGALGIWTCITHGAAWPLDFVECANHFMTAVLLVYVFRRFSPGLILSCIGFTAFSLSILEILPVIGQNPVIDVNISRVIVLGKVVAALGLILLALEDQLAINQTGQERERRTRSELEAYTNLILSRRRVEDFDRQANEICQTVIEHSRFAQAALLLQYQGAIASPVLQASIRPLSPLSMNWPCAFPLKDFLGRWLRAARRGSQPHTVKLDLTPWLRPGDDLKRLHFTSVLAVPMTGRTGHRRRSCCWPACATLHLRTAAGEPAQSLSTSTRCRARRSAAHRNARRPPAGHAQPDHDAGKAHRLRETSRASASWPATSHSSSTTRSPSSSATPRCSTKPLHSIPRSARGIESILSEARRMRATLESLTRISRPQNGQFTAVSVAEMLSDLEQLHRSEFLPLHRVPSQHRSRPAQGSCATRSSCARPCCIACSSPLRPSKVPGNLAASNRRSQDRPP
jgi:hypothetical protein